jgi:toxin ParE1/3/4
MRHKLTGRAESDLKDIYRYTVHSFGARQAEKYLRELDAVFELIGDHPEIGRVYEGKTRHFVHGKHIILYRVLNETVVIGRIFHGAQSSRSAD